MNPFLSELILLSYPLASFSFRVYFDFQKDLDACSVRPMKNAALLDTYAAPVLARSKQLP